MRIKNTQITIITEQRTQDSSGFSTITETERTAWAAVDSITGSEFSSAGQLNIQPSLRATVWAFEYNGETIIKIGTVRYGVYRTYQRSTDEIELYLERKAGA